MKRFKKALALILSCILVIAMAIPTMADETPVTSTTGSIIIRDNKAGHKYDAYQIFAGQRKSTLLSCMG